MNLSLKAKWLRKMIIVRDDAVIERVILIFNLNLSISVLRNSFGKYSFNTVSGNLKLKNYDYWLNVLDYEYLLLDNIISWNVLTMPLKLVTKNNENNSNTIYRKNSSFLDS